MRSHLSGALHHGWEIAIPPPRPMITIPRNRHVTADQREQVALCWSDLTDDEVANGVTCPARTVVDCARRLPFGEALAVADSALRSGQVTRAELLAAAAAPPRTGRRAAVRVAEAADARAANPVESMLRAIASDIHRYTELTRAGWRVARFTWAEVRDEPDYVRSVLLDLVSAGRPLGQFG